MGFNMWVFIYTEGDVVRYGIVAISQTNFERLVILLIEHDFLIDSPLFRISNILLTWDLLLYTVRKRDSATGQPHDKNHVIKRTR